MHNDIEYINVSLRCGCLLAAYRWDHLGGCFASLFYCHARAVAPIFTHLVGAVDQGAGKQILSTGFSEV
jgi:hypothetical protein